MLVRTPAPYSTESNRGFLLRICEANGYSSPTYLLSMLGNSPEAMEQPKKIDLRALGRLLGAQQGALDFLSSKGDSYSEVLLFGHRLKRFKHRMPIRSADVAFCPDCVVEQGFLDIFWELRMVVACPIHKRRLVSSCPRCKKRINWFRPGLLQCRCGASFTKERRLPASDSITQLMSVLRAITHHLPQLGLPWDPERLCRTLEELYRASGWWSWRFSTSLPAVTLSIQEALDGWIDKEMFLHEGDEVQWSSSKEKKRYMRDVHRQEAVNEEQLPLFMARWLS